MKKAINIILIILFFILGFLMIIRFDICKNAVSKGIMLCSNVIIPSLFPFTVCVMFLINSGALARIPVFKFFGKPFRLNSEEFAVFIFSLIGGYPTGAKMINTLFKNGKTSQQKAKLMTCYCVNAGPAFIISVVGNTVLHSEKLGVIIFFSHIFSSVILALIFGLTFKDVSYSAKRPNFISPIDNFVLSTSQAAQAVMNICFYIIFFAVISAYTVNFSYKIPILKYVSYLLEITIGVNNTRNIFLIAFLLGFSGICIWFQIFSVTKNCKPPILFFILSRIMHGTISIFLTYLFVKICRIQIPIFSNNILFEKEYCYGSVALSISIVVLIIFFILTVTSKKYSGNIVEDLL